MPTNPWDLSEGYIPGLRLPQSTWNALRLEGITTIEQLRAMADQVHKLPGIGRKSAQVIREELARLAPPDQDQ
jgi:DNA-directed RNA polymerase alpha subunit